jgi:hypothetical protein
MARPLWVNGASKLERSRAQNSPTTKLLLALLAMAFKKGHPALFLTSDAVPGRVADAIKSVKFEIFATSLPKAQELTLRNALAAAKLFPCG